MHCFSRSGRSLLEDFASRFCRHTLHPDLAQRFGLGHQGFGLAHGTVVEALGAPVLAQPGLRMAGDLPDAGRSCGAGITQRLELATLVRAELRST